MVVPRMVILDKDSSLEKKKNNSIPYFLAQVFAKWNLFQYKPMVWMFVANGKNMHGLCPYNSNSLPWQLLVSLRLSSWDCI